MQRLAMIIALLCHIPWLCAAPYHEGKMRLTFRDSARGRDIPVTIIYPADSTGTNTPLVGSASNAIPTFGVVVMGHGYQMPVTAYASFASNICRQTSNYIVVLPETGTGLFPSHSEFAADMVSCLTYMQRENGRTESMWKGHIANDNIIAGHSMGGGSAFLAAKSVLQRNDLTLTAVIALAPAETNPSSKAAAANVDVPTLILAGGNDCVTPLTGTVQPIYDSLPGPCKVLAVIPGASHCQFADENSTCSLGELNCRASIPRATQFDRCWRYINAMLARNDSVAVAIDDTQLQTTMKLFKGDELQAVSTEACQGDTVELRSKLNSPDLLWLPDNVRGQTYKVVIRDSTTRVTLVNTHCFGDTRIDITLRRLPDAAIRIAAVAELCPEGTTTLRAQATNASRIEWSTGEVGDSISVASAGTYTATAISQFGCAPATDTVVVRLRDVPSIPIVQRGSTVFCNGEGSVELEPTFDTDRYDRVIWSNGITGNVLAIRKPGQYVISARLYPREEGDCIVRTDTLRLTVRDVSAPVPTITYIRDTLWSSPGQRHAWTVDATPIPGGDGPWLVPQRSGLYAVEVSYDTTIACTATSKSINVNLTTSVAGETPPPTIRVKNGILHLDHVSAGSRVRLYTYMGALVDEGFTAGDGKLSLPRPIPNGLYFVVIDTVRVYALLVNAE